MKKGEEGVNERFECRPATTSSRRSRSHEGDETFECVLATTNDEIKLNQLDKHAKHLARREGDSPRSH